MKNLVGTFLNKLCEVFTLQKRKRTGVLTIMGNLGYTGRRKFPIQNIEDILVMGIKVGDSLHINGIGDFRVVYATQMKDPYHYILDVV